MYNVGEVNSFILYRRHSNACSSGKIIEFVCGVVFSKCISNVMLNENELSWHIEANKFTQNIKMWLSFVTT